MEESNSDESYSGDDADYLPENDISYSDDSYVTQSEKEDSDMGSSRRKSKKRKCKNTKRSKPEESDSHEPNSDVNYTPMKNNFCFVCGKGVIELSCHLKTHAEDIPEIAEALAFPPGSKEQERLLSTFLRFQELKSMSGNDSANIETHAAQNEVELPKDLSPDAQTILENMKPGKITSLVKKDFLLVQLAQHFCDRYGDGPYKYDYVTQRLRSIGNVLLTLTKDSIFCFNEALKLENFDKVVEAVKHTGRYNKETQCYDQPQLVLQIAYCLRKLAAIAVREAQGDAQKIKDAKKFMQLCSEEWLDLDSKNGSFTRVTTRKKRLAFTRDVQRFYKYLETTSTAAMETLIKHNYPHVYSAFCKVTLAQVSILNKCAPEISKMKLKTFQDRDDSTQELSKHFIKINTLSRSGQRVSVLLTRELVSALSLLVNKREACGVNKSNSFLFAKCDFSCKSAYHSSQCIKSLSRLCGVQNTQHLTLPVFYKEMARMFQTLNLEDDELQHLAKLLGHNIPTDRNYYQSLKAAPVLAKITKLLLSMENECVKKFKGLSFEAIASDGELEQQCEDGPAEEDYCYKDKASLDKEATSNHTDVSSENSENEDHSSSSSGKTWAEKDVCDEGEEEKNRSDAVPRPDCSEGQSLTPSGQDDDWVASDGEHSGPDCSEGQILTPSGQDDDWVASGGEHSSNEAKRDTVYTKRNFCFVCGKPQTKLARHLRTHRMENEEIAKVFAFRKNSKERKIELQKLRNKGNYLNNQKVLKKGRGELKVKLKSQTSASGDYVFCPYCKLMVTRKYMYKHASRCTSAPTNSVFKISKLLLMVSTKGSSNVFEISSQLRQLLKKLPQDELSVINKDTYLLELAQSWYQSGEVQAEQEGYIRQKLRQMAKLLIMLEKHSISSFEEALKPENFSKVVDTVKEFCGFNEDNNSKHKPTVMKMLMFLLQKMAVIKYAKALNNSAGNQDITEAENFFRLCKDQWGADPLGPGTKGPSLIKFTRDVQHLYLHLRKNTASACKVLTMFRSPPSYRSLLKAIGAQLSILNKGKPEVSCISLQSFNERDQTPSHQESAVTPSSFEQILSRCFLKFNLKTTRGKEVVVTFTHELLSNLSLLISKRQACGVHEQNPYVFGTSCRNVRFFNINRWTTWFSPELRSVYFRKYTHQLFQILSLTNRELEQVAKLLGREILTDRDYYDSPEAAEDLAKITFLLSALEKGTFEQYEGKGLQEIELPDHLDPDPEARTGQRCPAEEGNVKTILLSKAKSKTKQRKRKRQDSEESELDCKNSEVLPAETYDEIEEQPASMTPVKTSAMRMERPDFSDNEEDMNVDFDLDSDSEEERKEHDGRDTTVKTTSGEDKQTVKDQETKEQKRWLSVVNRTHSGEGSSTAAGKNRRDCSATKERKRFESESSESSLEKNEETIPKKDNKCSMTADRLLESDLNYKNADLQLDFSTDREREEDNEEENQRKSTLLTPEIKDGKDSSKSCAFEGQVEKHSQKKEQQNMDVDIRAVSANLYREIKIKTLEALCRRKELKIIVPKIDLGKPSAKSQSSTELKDRAQKKNQPVAADVNKDQVQLSPKPSDSKDKTVGSGTVEPGNRLNNDKVVHIICSGCLKPMMKGKMAYQKKGTSKVFCSKSCLFEKSAVVKPVAKICYHCNVVISKPLDVIMAAVNTNGIIKYFCSQSCLSSIRAKTSAPSPCNVCSLPCTATCELTLNGVVLKFCGEYCLKSFFNVGLVTCENCHTLCRVKPLKLKMEHDVINICKEECLKDFVKGITAPRRCPVCGCFCPMSEMFYFQNENHTVELLCSYTCRTSHKIGLSMSTRFKGNNAASAHLKNNTRQSLKNSVETPQLCSMCLSSHLVSDMVEHENGDGSLTFFCSSRCMMMFRAQNISESGLKTPPPELMDCKEEKPSVPDLSSIKEEQIDEGYNHSFRSSEDIEILVVKKEEVAPDSVFLESLSSPEDVPHSPAVAHLNSPAPCSNCKKVPENRGSVFQRKGLTETFCSTSYLSEFYQEEPAPTSCHFCLQAISEEAENVLQETGNTEGTLNTFCSKVCLSSFRYKEKISTKIQYFSASPPSDCSVCSMCSRHCISKHEIILHNVVYKVCSNPCFSRFCNINHLSVCSNCRCCCRTPIRLQMKGDKKLFCRKECLNQFKKTVQTSELCAMCHTPHTVAEMVENKNDKDTVELFCSSSCLKASKIMAVSASGKPQNCDNCGKTTVPACHLIMSDLSVKSFCSLTCSMAFKECPNKNNTAANPTNASNQTQRDVSKEPEELLCAHCQRIIKITPKVVLNKDTMDFLCSQACAMKFKIGNNIKAICEFCSNESIIRDCLIVDGKMNCFCSDGCKMLFRHKVGKTWGKHCGSCSYCLCCSKTLVTAKYENATEEFCSENCLSDFKQLHNNLSRCDACGTRGQLTESLPLVGEVKHFCDLKCLFYFCHKKGQIDPAPEPEATAESFPVIANVISLASFIRQKQEAEAAAQKAPDIKTKVVGHASVQTDPREMKNKSVLCAPLVHNKGVSCVTKTVTAQTQTEKEPELLVIPVPVYVPVPMNMYSQFTPTPLVLPFPLPVPVSIPEPKEKVQHECSETIDTKETQEDADLTKRQCPLKADEQISMVTEETQKQTDDKTEALDPCPTSAQFVGVNGDLQSSQKHVASVSQDKEDVHQKNKGRTKSEFSANRKLFKVNSQYGLKVWKRWTQWRLSQSRLDLDPACPLVLKDVLWSSTTDLSKALCCFISEVKRQNGETYSPDSLFYICIGIQQHLFDNARLENIFTDEKYSRFSTELTRILRGFKPSARGDATGYSVSRVKEEFLWECKQLGTSSPMVLLNTLLFFCCKYLQFSSLVLHRRLAFTRIKHITKIKHNNSKKSYLRFYLPTSVRETDTDGVPAKKAKRSEETLDIRGDPDNPLRCPVRLYEFYLSKCPESVKKSPVLFYLHPEPDCVPSSPQWFSCSPLDDATLEAMLVRALAVREVQGRLRQTDLKLFVNE